MDAISEARLQEVAPQLSQIIHTLSTMLEPENIYIRVVQALRSWSQQDQLYTQGRTTPGPGATPDDPLGKRVTDVRGGYSYHNFGLAVDCVPSIGGLNAPAYIPDWNPQHPQWKRMQAIGISLGLTSGACWKDLPDYPHFQITGRFPEAGPDDEVRQIFTNGGMQAVWSEIWTPVATT